MAPNKKKKKPASNPARGFATTSTASKAKVNEVEVDRVDASTEEPARINEKTQGPANVLSNDIDKNVEKALHELSPEELEKQLEESTLQVFVETHGTKTKKEVSRHLSRLQTERRLLRAQAEPLVTRQWLPQEIMQLCMGLLEQSNLPRSNNMPVSCYGIADLSDDDLLIKIWTLRQLLPQLGFSLDATTLALRHLLSKKDSLDPKSLSAAKDSVWGLDESLSWLALVCGIEDLPPFEPMQTQKLAVRGRRFKGSPDVSDPGKVQNFR